MRVRCDSQNWWRRSQVASRRLPGCYANAARAGGHWNAWGTPTWWEFREPTEAATSRAMHAAAASGAFVSVNHPKPFGPPWQYPAATGYHAIEVWNGDWPQQNDVALSFWDQQLRAGRRIVALRDGLLLWFDLFTSVITADFVACLAGDLDAGIALGAETMLADQRTNPRGQRQTTAVKILFEGWRDSNIAKGDTGKMRARHESLH